MLRTHEPSVYDMWVSNEMPFNDSRVLGYGPFGLFALNDKYVNGDQLAIFDFRDAPNGLFTSPAECMMHRQASFIPAFFPEGVNRSRLYLYFLHMQVKIYMLLGGGTIFTEEYNEATRIP